MDLLIQTFSDIAQGLIVAGNAFSYIWFIALPVLFYSLFRVLWDYHIQTQYWLAAEWMLLEIIPPKNIERSPKPMEQFFSGIAGVEKSFTIFELYMQGAYADSFSLELVSDGGIVHFYIRTMKKYRNIVEAHLFAQYPDIEIVEVPDYVDDVPKIIPNGKWDIWGTDFEFTKDDAYPIRTYTKFQEDVTGKMIDPLAGLVEIMGKLGPNQKLWLQMIISPTSPGSTKKAAEKIINKLKGKEDKKEGILERIMADISDVFFNLFPALGGEVEFSKKDKKEEQPLEFRLSPGERDILKAVEEAQGKLTYRTKMRMVYVGRREGYDKSVGVSGFIGGLKQFADENLNGFKPNGDTKTAATYYFIQPRLRYRQRKILRRYRNRSNDGPPKTRMILNTEELATLYHLPDMQVVAPSVIRVEAKRGGAPANLPVE